MSGNFRVNIGRLLSEANSHLVITEIFDKQDCCVDLIVY